MTHVEMRAGEVSIEGGHGGYVFASHTPCLCSHILYNVIYIYNVCTYSHRQNYEKKINVSIYRRRLSMIEKLRTFFFHNYCFHNCCFHNYFFSIILSVTVCPSIRNLNAF